MGTQKNYKSSPPFLKAIWFTFQGRDRGEEKGMRGDISVAALYRDVAILDSALIVGDAAAAAAAAIVSIVNVAVRRCDITEDIVGVADLDSALLILGSHFCEKKDKIKCEMSIIPV